MPAGGRHFQVQVTIFLRFCGRVAGLSQKGIIPSIYQQSRDLDVSEERFATALLPVVFGILETMNRRSVAIIKVFEGPEAIVTAVVNFSGHQGHHRPDFAVEAGEEMPHVNPVYWPGQLD